MSVTFEHILFSMLLDCDSFDDGGSGRRSKIIESSIIFATSRKLIKVNVALHFAILLNEIAIKVCPHYRDRNIFHLSIT